MSGIHHALCLRYLHPPRLLSLVLNRAVNHTHTHTHTIDCVLVRSFRPGVPRSTDRVSASRGRLHVERPTARPTAPPLRVPLVASEMPGLLSFGASKRWVGNVLCNVEYGWAYTYKPKAPMACVSRGGGEDNTAFTPC